MDTGQPLFPLLECSDLLSLELGSLLATVALKTDLKALLSAVTNLDGALCSHLVNFTVCYYSLGWFLQPFT